MRKTMVERGAQAWARALTVLVAVSGSAAAAPGTTVAWEAPARATRAHGDKVTQCANGTLYALDTDRSIWINIAGGTDATWVRLGALGLTQDITCGNELVAFNDDRKLWRNVGSPTSFVWAPVGQPGGAKQVSVGVLANPTRDFFFALNDDNSVWSSPTGADGSWTRIGTNNNIARIAGGRTGVWALYNNQDIYRGDGVQNNWVLKGHRGGATTIADDATAETGKIWAFDSSKQLWHGAIPAPNGIEYQGGHVFTGTPNVHFIWYGTWSATDKQILHDFARTVGGSSYYRIVSTYDDAFGGVVSNSLSDGVDVSDASESQGNVMVDQPAVERIIQNAVRTMGLPAGDNNIYAVMASNDVRSPSFCNGNPAGGTCGYHQHATLFNGIGQPFEARFTYAINPINPLTGASCGCIPDVLKAPAPTPNGSRGADALVDIMAHEIAETVTDPADGLAWVTPVIAGGFEVGDKCPPGSYAPTFHTASGATANVHLGTRDFLVQQIFKNAGGGGCVLTFP
jgi:hypothetical protein